MQRRFILMLDYPAVFALAAVVREGSFERAARTLHLTPSAVSQRVRQLEERCGRILVRRGTPCTATEEGRALLRHAEAVGLMEEELRASLPWLREQADSDDRPLLRVGVNADSLASWFVEALAQFTQPDDVLVSDGAGADRALYRRSHAGASGHWLHPAKPKP